MRQFLIIIAVFAACAADASVQITFNHHRLRRWHPVGNESTTPRPNLRQRVENRIMRHRQRNTARVCYDIVGCFDVPHSRSPLQKTPEAPTSLDTKFYLFRRDLLFSQPDIIYYDDVGVSLNGSTFNPRQPLTIYIHGYMSRWNEKGAFLAADAYLKLADCNFIVMDWSKGARGPQYTSAAANTEIAGRQLGVLLLGMIAVGLDPKDVHLIGFSLGAHVAGCAAELVKTKGSLLGRITGLDAAGPLFRHNNLKDKSKKLDKSDANFVDVLHTDSSPVFSDGFGLWEPIGHVDFFANGGEEQPGCTDRPNSVVATTFERTLNRDSACSHLRAYHLYLESLLNKAQGNKCEFMAYKCPGGLPTFKSGQCFPQIENKKKNPLALDIKYYTDIGRMGVDAEGSGVMYFTTTGKTPYCGDQIQAIITLSPKSNPTKGMVVLKLQHGDSSTTFNIQYDVQEPKYGEPIYGLTAAESGSILPKMETMIAYISYHSYDYIDRNNNTVSYSKNIIVDQITVRDIYTNSWRFCGKDTMVGETADETRNPALIKLSQREC